MEQQNDTTYMKHYNAYRKAWIDMLTSPYGVIGGDTEARENVANIGLKTFPINKNWIIDATFIPANELNIAKLNRAHSGLPITMPIVGIVKFSINNKLYEAQVLAVINNQYHMSFKDKTNGITTNGAGRVIFIDRPIPNKDVQFTFKLDFNLAVNTPCGISRYAGCPIPPKENHIEADIEAGELVAEWLR
jgi:uncharacterized protein (DUF1684 family)